MTPAPTREEIHKRVVMDVREFGITCPDCDVSDLYLGAEEQKNGIDFEPELSEKFRECSKCGCLIEVVGVRIEPLTNPTDDAEKDRG